MNTLYPQLTSRKCSECGSFLILVDKKVETVEDQHLPVTTSIYQCSNKECQESTDKKTAERVKKYAEQEVARQNRLEKMKANRRSKVQPVAAVAAQ